MIALASEWAGDLAIGPTGDLATFSPDNEVEQRIIRRLLTNPGEYVWHTQYGAGLGLQVGRPYSVNQMDAAIRRALSHEAQVASLPPPTVTVVDAGSASTGTFAVTIQYAVANSATQNLTSFNIGP